MYRRGIVVEVDAARCRVKVRLPDKQDAVSSWLDVLQRNTADVKDYGLPAVNELVAVLFDERDEAGCILGSLYTEANKPAEPNAEVRRVTFADGTIVQYIDGTLRISGPAAVDVQSTGVVTIAPATEIADSLKIAGGGSAPALAPAVSNALSTLKSAINSAVPTPNDGGAALKTQILAALASWPPDMAATKLTTD